MKRKNAKRKCRALKIEKLKLHAYTATRLAGVGGSALAPKNYKIFAT